MLAALYDSLSVGKLYARVFNQPGSELFTLVNIHLGHTAKVDMMNVPRARMGVLDDWGKIRRISAYRDWFRKRNGNLV